MTAKQVESAHRGMQEVLSEVKEKGEWATMESLLRDLEATRRRIQREQVLDEIECEIEAL